MSIENKKFDPLLAPVVPKAMINARYKNIIVPGVPIF